MTTTPTALQVKNGGALLLVGTTKGAFLLSADGTRTRDAAGRH
jgi:hypothetical protein